eukprot:scaffold1605_cov141-Cylindrotheca_fusiformis.AAC.19
MRPSRLSVSASPKSRSSIGKCRRKVAKYACLILSSLFVYAEIQLLRRMSLIGNIYRQEEVSPLMLHKRSYTEDMNRPRRRDGTFNGLPIHLQILSNHTYTRPKSLLHCVAEDYQPDSWLQRSCHFTFMCLNLDTNEYQVYSRPEDVDLRHWSEKRPLMDLQETLIHEKTTLSLGGIRRDWDSESVEKCLDFFPSILSTPPSRFYALPGNTVMIPFYSTGGWSPFHLFWDDFVAIFNLMYIFQLHDGIPLLLRHAVPNGVLPESCDDSVKRAECEETIREYSPLMMRSPTILTSQLEVELRLDLNHEPKSNLVCAKHGLVGTGALTDHGTHKTNGWSKGNRGIAHNHGRGDLFWKFREFCLGNLGLADNDRLGSPFKILVATPSLEETVLRSESEILERLLRQNFDTDMASIELHVGKNLRLVDKVHSVLEATVLLVFSFEDAVSATFLPRGATLIIFFDEAKVVDGQVRNWDLFNNLSYLRVHWFPIGTVRTQDDSQALIHVVRDALRNQEDRD